MLTFLSMDRGCEEIRLTDPCPISLGMVSVTIGLIGMTPESVLRHSKRRAGRIGFRVGPRLHQRAGVRMTHVMSRVAAGERTVIGTSRANRGTAAVARAHAREATTATGAGTRAADAASTAQLLPSTTAAIAAAAIGRLQLKPGTAAAPGLASSFVCSEILSF